MGASEPNPVVEEVIESSRRYRYIARSVIDRLAREEMQKSKSLAEAVKRTKRRLHQIFGAYATPLPYEKLLHHLREAAHDHEQFKQQCRQILAMHASSQERLPEIESFYPALFKLTGTTSSVLDLACGLNPLTLPWMHLPAGARYVAGDIDREMVAFLDGFMKLTNIDASAIVNDLVAAPPDLQADMAFLFKTLPCLQHQVDDLGAIVDAIRAPIVVCTFPTRSLGNRDKGMAENYRTMFQQLAAGRAWVTKQTVLGNELVFIVRKT